MIHLPNLENEKVNMASRRKEEAEETITKIKKERRPVCSRFFLLLANSKAGRDKYIKIWMDS